MLLFHPCDDFTDLVIHTILSHSPPPPSFDQRPLPPILPPTNQPYTFIDPWENFVQTPVTSSHNPGNHNVNQYQEFQPNEHEGNSHQHHTSHQPQTATSSHSHTHHHAQNEHNEHTRHSFQNHSHQETHHNPSHHQEHHHNPFQNHQSHIHHSHNPGHSHHENNPSHSQPHTHHTFHSDNSNAQSFHESNPACSSSQELTINQDNEQLEEDVQQHEDCNENEAGLARALAQVPIGTPISAEQLAYEDHIHRQHWEEGHIDYLGKDSWDNIWKKISQTIEPSKPPAAEPSQTTSE
ncbi:uncharacterized histidine-rich protein DDB_G0274557-like, partial [Diaphorina citri]|uniref:Uncharacterized histidine-rich protein DDB_G0274557-like n=1 Tax=Diaphorina citri TaxID=121845 RepID=A0A1S4EMG8_DIACI